MKRDPITQIRSWSQSGVPLVLFTVVLVVYLLTLSPGALGGDAGELQFVPSILSLPHPTGTPLYVLLGKVWSVLPLGPSVAWRMSLLAAVSASLATVLVYLAVYVQFERLWPAVSAALSLALGLTFWEQAVLADKYAFNALMVAAVLYLALRWGKSKDPRVLGWLALIYGLSLTHHRTMVLLAPALLFYVWSHEKRALWQNRRRLLRLVALCLAPLLLYLYLPWANMRDLPPGTWHPQTLDAWFDYLLDRGWSGSVRVDPAELGERLDFYRRILWRDFSAVGVLLGLGGLVVQCLRRPRTAAFLLLIFVPQAFLAAHHHVPRHWVYFIPSFVVFALWVGDALSEVMLYVSFSFPDSPNRGKRLTLIKHTFLVILALIMLVWPWLPVPERYALLRHAHLGWGTLDPWRQTLKTGYMADRVGQSLAGVASEAIIVCDWEQATPLWVFQQVEGWRPDVRIVYPMDRLDEMEALVRPLYIARTVPGVAERWHPSFSGALIALQDAPLMALPTGAVGETVDFGHTIALAGHNYGQGEPTFRPPQVVPLTLYWQTLAVPEHDYSVSLRVLGGDGHEVFKIDSQHPVLGMYPTTRWTQGEIIADYYEIQLPPDLAPGVYQWGVVLYRALPEGGWENLGVNDTGAALGIGGSFTVGQ